MVNIEKLLSQRDRIIHWSPIIALILIVAIEFAPFYQAEDNVTNKDLTDEQITIEYDFYDEYRIVQSSTEDYTGWNFSKDFFGGSIESINEINDPGEEEYLSQMMADLNSELSVWLTISLILTLLIIVGTKEKIHINKYFNHATINGTLLGFISITSVLFIFSAIGYGSDFSDNAYGDLDDGDAEEFEYNDGFWGELYIEIENSDGESSINHTTWGPHIGFLLLIFLFIVTLIGSISCFVTLFEQFETPQAPIWFTTDDTPDKISKGIEKLPSILISATVILVMISVFTPWYHIGQTWEGFEGGFGNDAENRTTHEFGWTLSPFMVIFDNQSGLDERVTGEKSTSYNSYSDHPELESISDPLLELRWPLICVLILCIITISKRMSTRISEAIEGEEKCWNTILLAAVVISMSLANSSFEEGIFRKAEDDLYDLSPSYYSKPTFVQAKDTNFGQNYTVVYDGSFFPGENFKTYWIEITWGNSIGAKIAQLSTIIGMFAIALIWAPFTIKHINETRLPKFNQEQLELWKGRPAVGVMISVLLLTSLGGGVGELIASSESSAPGSIRQWYLNWDETENNSVGSATMSDGEVITIEFDTRDFDLGNTTYVFFYMSCYEGEQQSQLDTLDSVTWEITAPEGVDDSGMQTQGELVCDTSTGSDDSGWFGEWEFPEVEIFAQSEEEVLELFKWISLGDGVWTLTLTADIGEDNSPIDQDDGCNSVWEIRAFGMDGLRAIADDE